MNVKFTAHILSETVENILLALGPPKTAETVKFCLLMDKFFDCCIVRYTVECLRKDKPFLKKYDDLHNERF